MRFKTDENLPVEVAELLRQSQHDARTVPEQQMAGQTDVQVAQVCRSESRALVTLDLDFSDIRHYPPEDYNGIIVLRPAVQNRSSLIRLINQVQALLAQEPLHGRLWIVDDHRVRIRGGNQHASP
jgi:predicted nuclease of predicted toxin-antitoxin system